jgi:hypothetical protein
MYFLCKNETAVSNLYRISNVGQTVAHLSSVRILQFLPGSRHTSLHITGPSCLLCSVFLKVSEGISSLLQYLYDLYVALEIVTERFLSNNRSAHEGLGRCVMWLWECSLAFPVREDRFAQWHNTTAPFGASSVHSYSWKPLLSVRLRLKFKNVICWSNETRWKLAVPQIYISFPNYVAVHTMTSALGFTQPLIEMRTRSSFWE